MKQKYHDFRFSAIARDRQKLHATATARDGRWRRPALSVAPGKTASSDCPARYEKTLAARRKICISARSAAWEGGRISHRDRPGRHPGSAALSTNARLESRCKLRET